MSLPTFKFKPDLNSSDNIGLSPDLKLKKAGIVPDIISNAKDRVSSIEFPDLPSLNMSDMSNNDDEETSFFSFSFIIRMILIAVILWFMWVNLANNGDFNLGSGTFGEDIMKFFKNMEENGKVLYARITGNIADYKSINDPSDAADADANNDADADADDNTESSVSDPNSDGSSNSKITTEIKQKRDFKSPTQTRSDNIHNNAPVPISMSNSADKKPGFNHNDEKYTFLDKAVRNYGPSPAADDSTSLTQKHQSGKAGYCYIGEDRGFRSCINVEAGDKCMSGEVFNRHDICVNPSLRE